MRNPEVKRYPYVEDLIPHKWTVTENKSHASHGININSFVEEVSQKTDPNFKNKYSRYPETFIGSLANSGIKYIADPLFSLGLSFGSGYESLLHKLNVPFVGTDYNDTKASWKTYVNGLNTKIISKEDQIKMREDAKIKEEEKNVLKSISESVFNGTSYSDVTLMDKSREFISKVKNNNRISKETKDRIVTYFEGKAKAENSSNLFDIPGSNEESTSDNGSAFDQISEAYSDIAGGGDDSISKLGGSTSSGILENHKTVLQTAISEVDNIVKLIKEEKETYDGIKDRIFDSKTLDNPDGFLHKEFKTTFNDILDLQFQKTIANSYILAGIDMTQEVMSIDSLISLKRKDIKDIVDNPEKYRIESFDKAVAPVRQNIANLVQVVPNMITIPFGILQNERTLDIEDKKIGLSLLELIGVIDTDYKYIGQPSTQYTGTGVYDNVNLAKTRSNDE